MAIAALESPSLRGGTPRSRAVTSLVRLSDRHWRVFVSANKASTTVSSRFFRLLHLKIVLYERREQQIIMADGNIHTREDGTAFYVSPDAFLVGIHIKMTDSISQIVEHHVGPAPPGLAPQETVIWRDYQIGL